MSRRYGRQQKRKARARIAELEKRVAEIDCTVSSAKSIINIARETCPNSICFEPMRIDNPYWFRFHQHEAIHAFPMTDKFPEPMQININAIDLYKLEIDLREGDFGSAVHFRTRLSNPHNNDCVAGYTISKLGFINTPTKFIVEELINHMKNDVSQQGYVIRETTPRF